jgi:hypothetical protein
MDERKQKTNYLQEFDIINKLKNEISIRPLLKSTWKVF